MSRKAIIAVLMLLTIGSAAAWVTAHYDLGGPHMLGDRPYWLLYSGGGLGVAFRFVADDRFWPIDFRYGPVRLFVPYSRFQVVFIEMWLPTTIFGCYPAWCLLSWYRHRRKPGHCACGYDLTGNESGVCPECGTEVAQP